METYWIAIFAFIGLALAFAAYKLMIFSKPVISMSSLPELNVAYSVKTGPYGKTWREKFRIEEVLERKFGIKKKTSPSVGIYFDDPKAVQDKDCRAIIGIVLPSDFQNTEEVEGVKFGKIEAMKEVVKVSIQLRSYLGIIFVVEKMYKELAKFLGGQPEKKEITVPLELINYEKSKYIVIVGVGQFGGLMSLLPPMKK